MEKNALISPKEHGFMKEWLKIHPEDIVAVASGERVKSEATGFHDLAIFKQGVTL